MISRYLRKAAVIGLLAGIVLVGGTISSMREDKAFEQHGETTQAEAESAAVPGSTYQGALVYQTKDGQSVLIPSEHVPMTIRQRIAYLKTVEITYLPEDTSKVRFALWPIEPASKKNLLVGVLLFVLALVYFVLGGRRG